MAKSLIAVIICIAVLTALSITLGMHNITLRQSLEETQIAQAFLKQCPLPPKGSVLIIEGTWAGQKDGEMYRCLHARPSPAGRTLGSAT